MFGESLKVAKFIKHYKKYRDAKDEISKQKTLQYIQNLLGHEGGLLIKFLQYQRGQKDELDQFEHINTKIMTGIHINEIRQVLKSELKEEIYEKIKDISTEAFPASIGQVHKAQIENQSVAIKVQYPSIEKVFKEQLRLFDLLPKFTGAPLKKLGVDIYSYQKKLEDMVDRECNYLIEAKNLEQWSFLLAPLEGVSVPELKKDFLTKKVLVMNFIEGDGISTVAKTWSRDDKKKVAFQLLDAYFKVFFENQQLQGDTNLGNFIFEQNPTKVWFIDLGQVIHFSSKFTNSIATALKRKMAKKPINALSFFENLGFDKEKLLAIEARLDLIVDILFEPFLLDFSFNLNNWKYKENLELVLGEDKWFFRSAGSVDFFIFMKSFMGIKTILEQLNVSLFFKPIVEKRIANFTEIESISQVDQKESQHRVQPAQKLRILVTEGNIEKVKVTLPFEAIYELENFMNDDIKQKIREKNIKLKQIIHDSLKDGAKRKEVFSLDDGQKRILISMV